MKAGTKTALIVFVTLFLVASAIGGFMYMKNMKRKKENGNGNGTTNGK